MLEQTDIDIAIGYRAFFAMMAIAAIFYENLQKKRQRYLAVMVVGWVCQRSAWPGHKAACKGGKRLRARELMPEGKRLQRGL